MNNNNKAIFTPIKLGRHELKHRVVLAPLTRFRATLDGKPTDSYVKYYKQRASPGGFMITEATSVSPLACGFPHTPGIFTQSQISQWKKVVEAVHEKEAIIFLQVWHVGRAGTKFLNPNQEEVVSASSIAISGSSVLTRRSFEVPQALDHNGIRKVIEDHKQSALNAIKAGFDGMEISSATGYLLDQFINSSSNKRTDEYGGSIENRCRFVLELVDAVVDAIGEERTAILFLNFKTDILIWPIYI
jgi:2,4-dienoyl-CoA reductase-like NADH-dependent reductase (Old Yellow Enzyme family)